MAKKKLVKKGRRVREDGSVWYYYPKRRPGPKRKPGPKKKKVSHPRVWPSWDYIIVMTRENKQNKYIGRFHTIQEAYDKKEELEELNSKVVFPKQKINNRDKSYDFIEVKAEYLILKRNDQNEAPNKLRNEYGTLVDHEVEGNGWLIVDKFPCLIEETFWVYGYDSRNDRKTFDWIYNEFITEKITGTKTIVMVYLYNNKVIFQYDGDDFDFVTCKCKSDAIKFYNLISERSKKQRKQVILTGATGGHTERGKEIIDMIQKKTGWKRKVILEAKTIG